MSKAMSEVPLQKLAQGLSAVAARLEPKEAGEVAATFSLAMTNWEREGVIVPQSLVWGLSAVGCPVEPEEGTVTPTQAMTKTRDLQALQHLAQGLSVVLRREAASQTVTRQRTVAGVVSVLSSPGSVLVAPVLLRPALQPLPPPLPPQTLVELLKQPL